MLKIAGFFEMTRPGQPGGSPEKLTTLNQIFQALDYDLGVLDANVSRHMREQGDGLPRGWMSVGDQPHSKVFPVNGGKVGFLVFPPTPDRPDFSRITALAQKMSSNISLLIGISPWGAAKEREFLRERPQAVDILLGSGSGPAFKAKFPGSGRTIWVRPYPEGKTIHRISVASLAPRDLEKPWKPGENCNVRLIMLEGSIPRNPNIKEIMR